MATVNSHHRPVIGGRRHPHADAVANVDRPDRRRRPRDPRGRGLRGADDAARRRRRRRPRAVAVQARRRPPRAGAADRRRRRGRTCRERSRPRPRPATRSGTWSRIATAFRAFALAHPEAYALLFRRLPEGWNARRRPRLARVRGAVPDGRGDLRRRSDGSRPPGRSSPGRTGSSSMELAGAFRLGGDVDRAFAYGAERIAAAISERPRSRATMSGMHTTALIADADADRRRRPRPDGSAAARRLRGRLDRSLPGRGERRRAARQPEEVAEIVRACRAARVPLVPQGGNTGLVGGGIPRDGAVLLSLAPAHRRSSTSIADGGTVVAGAGATVAAVHRAAAEAGLGVRRGPRRPRLGDRRRHDRDQRRRHPRVPQRHDPRPGAGRRGRARRRDDRQPARTPPARTTPATPWPSCWPGPRARSGIVTAARLRLLPRLDRLAVAAFLGISSVDVVVRLAGSLRRSLPSLNAVELIAGDALDLVGPARRGPSDRGPPPRLPPRRGGRHPSTPSPPWSRPSIEPPTSTMPSSRPTARRASGCGRSGRACPRPSQREGVPHSIDVALPLGAARRVRRMAPGDDRAGVARGAADPVRPPARRQPPRQRHRARTPTTPPSTTRSSTSPSSSAARSARSTGSASPKAGWLSRDRVSGRPRGHARDQAGARPRRDPEPGRPPELSRGTLTPAPV